MDKWSLPSSWEWSSLEDVVDVGSHNIEPSGDPEKIFNYIALENIEKGTGRLVDFVPQKGRQIRSAKTVFNAGDVLYGKLRPYLQKAIIAPFDGVSVTDIVPLKPYGDGRFVFRYLLGPDHLAYISPLMAGIRMPRLRTGDLMAMPIPCAPLNEQRRIADKIDALQAKSRRAREALEAVGPLLEKFRQSVLAAAFRGDMTAEWREQHPDVEPAEKLLERIRAERRARWEEAELAKMRSKGIKPKDDKWKAKYTEPAYSDGPETQHVSSFVDTKQLGWTDCPLLGVCDDHRGIPYGIVQTGDPVDGGVPTVRCGDIKRFSVDLAGLKLVDPNISAGFERTVLTGGEVLIAIRGSVGEATVATADMAGMNISREVAMIPVLSGVNPRYVMYLLSSPVGQRLLLDKVKGVAQQGINLADLRQFPVPLPCANEQQAIVDLLDGAMTRIDAIQAHVEGSKADTCRNDQAILAKAFRGELVPQDPNDEPASVLLERIKAERERTGTMKSRVKR